MGLADDVINRYRENQNKGLADSVIERYKNSSQIPQPQPEEEESFPKSVFRSFTNYVKGRTAALTKTNYEDLSKPEKALGYMATPFYAGKDAFKLMTEGESALGEGFGKVMNLGDVAQNTGEIINRNSQLIVTLQNQMATADDERRKKIQKTIDMAKQHNKELLGNIKTDLTPEEKRKLWSGVIETGIDIGTLGGSMLAKGAVKQATRYGAKEAFKEGATFGATYGITGKMRDEEDQSLGGYAKSALAGAAFGGTLSAGLNKLLSKKKISGHPFTKHDVLDVSARDQLKVLDKMLPRNKEGVIQQKALTGRIDDMAQKIERQFGKKVGKELHKYLDNVQVKTAEEFREQAQKAVEKLDLPATASTLVDESLIGKTVRNFTDVFKKAPEKVDLSAGRKITPSKEVKIEVTAPKKTEVDVDKVIRDSGFVDYTVKKESRLKTLEGKTAQGKAKYDFNTNRGIIEVSSKADSKTKAHEFAHVVNYKLGTNQEKFSTELNQFIQGKKKNPPKAISDYAARTGQDSTQLAKDISAEIRKTSRLGLKDAFRSVTNPSEEFSAAVSNAMVKNDLVKEQAPKWAQFVESEIIRSKSAKRVKATDKAQSIATKMEKTKAPKEDKAMKFIEDTKVKFRESESVLHIPSQRIYAKVSKQQLPFLSNEVKNIPWNKADRPHLTPLSSIKRDNLKEVSLADMMKVSPNVRKAINKFKTAYAKGTHLDPTLEDQAIEEIRRHVKSISKTITEEEKTKFAKMIDDIKKRKAGGEKEKVRAHSRRTGDVKEYTRNRKQPKGKYRTKKDTTDTRNFESAEEFIKAQGTPVYHGSTKEIKAFESRDGGIYFTKDAGGAEKMAKMQQPMWKKEPVVLNQVVLDYKKPFIANEKNLKKLFKERITDQSDEFYNQRIEDYFDSISEVRRDTHFVIKDRGYDSIIIPKDTAGLDKSIESIVVFDKSQIKTKSQLIDIWNKAHGSKPKYRVAEDLNKIQLTTKILKRLGDRQSVSKQFILDMTNQGDIKQTEKDIIRRLLEEEGNKIDVAKFKAKVQAELLPLKRKKVPQKYEYITLPNKLRGNVANYSEHIYESPIKTSAGNVHFRGQSKKYFGHTRVEDMADNKTRRIIEIQSDLFQKGNLKRELKRQGSTEGEKAQRRLSELAKLEQYNDPTAHFRMLREEIAQAAKNEKTKLQVPTGETAMKIEGLGSDYFYEKDLGRYVKNNYDAKLITDSKGVTWYEIDIKPEMKGEVEAFRLKGDKVDIKENLTTKFLEYAKDKKYLSRQEILDFARRPEIKRGEADLLNRLGSELKEARVSAKEFADSIYRELLELNPVKVKEPEYQRITIKDFRRSKNYEEVVFESPIITNGSSHYPNSKKYFAHVRGDEVAEDGKKIWREQEIQSDLLQKEGLEAMEDIPFEITRRGIDIEATKASGLKRKQEIERLKPFTNDRYGERIMRERIKEKASKGYDKYRLPTGETIGKIEGFSEEGTWVDIKLTEEGGGGFKWNNVPFEPTALSQNTLKIGKRIGRRGFNKEWVITNILGDGRFKAVPMEKMQVGSTAEDIISMLKKSPSLVTPYEEVFDLTGKSNPQYRRYEKWGKFLKNKYGGKEVIDSQGNTWVEINLNKALAEEPVMAFRLKDDFNRVTGLDITDEQEKQIIKLNKRIFGDTNVKVIGQIISNSNALGYYEKGMINILKGQADAKDTFYHEAVHKYLDVFLTKEEHIKLLKIGREQYGIDDYAMVEEMIAEDFIRYAKSREGFTGKLKAEFDALIQRIKSYLGNKDEISALYADIARGQAKDILKETKKTIRVKTPASVTMGGKVKKNITPIKSESIRMDKLNTSDDVKEMIGKFSQVDKEVIDRQRRGKITNDELDELSSLTGLKPDQIINAEAGSIVNAENAFAVRKMMINMASDIVDTVKNLPVSPSKAQLLEFRNKMDKFRGIQKALAGFRTEAGRLLQSFKKEAMPEEYDVYDELIKAVAKIDQSEANSIQKAVKVGKLTKPDTLFSLAVKSGVEARTAFLLYSPTTHVANIVGNTWQALTAPLKKFIASKIDKQAIAKGEAKAHIQGMKDAIPEAWSQLKADMKDIFRAKEIEEVFGAEKITEVTRQRNTYELLKRLKVGDKLADKVDTITKSSFKMLQASDKFFRTINFAGELYSQAIRKAKTEGLSGDALIKRIDDLIDDPRQDEEFFEAIQKQVSISLFQEKTKASQTINRLREQYPTSKLVVPFVQTPLNVAIESVRTSPLGFLRPALAKKRGVEMTKAEKALAQAQATIGTALAGIGLILVADGKITGAPPKDYREREEFYASGKQPYSIKIGNKWVSYRRIEPVASVLANTANVYETIKESEDWQKGIAMAASGYASNFLDQTFLRGISDAYNAVTEPERYGKYFVQSYATSMIPSFMRSIAAAEDRTLRERETMRDAFKNIIPTQKETLPAKIDIFGNEVVREGGFIEGLVSPFYRSTQKDDPTIKALEESDYNLNTYGLDKINQVEIKGKAKEHWLRIVGRETKKELDKLTRSSRFQRMTPDEKEEALRETVSDVRTKYRKRVSAGLQSAFNKRKAMSKAEQKAYNEEIRGKLEERIFKLR